MKIYNTNPDEHNRPIDAYEYLKDRGVSRSGSHLELLIEMKLWNFVAKIANLFTKKDSA